MHWLIITENQEKASRFREVLRNRPEGYASIEISAAMISSRGLPWTVEVEVNDSQLNYTIKEKESYKETLKKISEISQEADRILLAFDATNIGEATAWEFEKRLGYNQCGRFRTHDMSSKVILDTLLQYESLDTKGLPKSNQAMAHAHWAQAVMDLTWASKVNEWLKKVTNYSAKATRLMGVILKSIAQRQRLEKRYKPMHHYEICLNFQSCSGQPNKHKSQGSGQETTNAYIIVPTLAQIGTGVGPKAKEFWEQKLKQSKAESIKGLEMPQPEPGKPWRFHHHEEAKIQKQHIKKFPYFIVDGTATVIETSQIQCPPTNINIHDYCVEKHIGNPEEIDRALNTLYYHGFITNPKSTFPSLSGQTILKMYEACSKRFPAITNEPRAFHTEEINPTAEAIHPTDWRIEPNQIKKELLGLKPLRLPAEEIGRLEKIYQIIFEWSIKSQSLPEKKELERHFLSGPIFLSRKQAQEREGKSFHINKEEPFHAHMTVLAMVESGTYINSKKEKVMECVNIEIKEVKTKPPKSLLVPELLSFLCKNGAGKRDTIINILNFLLENKMITNTKELKLNQKGEDFLKLLEENFGQYLDVNYIKTLNHSISQVESGKKSSEEVLNQWWFSLRSFLQSEKTNGTNILN